jgi:hypothetical protein
MHIQSSYWLYMVAIGHIHLISFPLLNIRKKKKKEIFHSKKMFIRTFSVSFFDLPFHYKIIHGIKVMV